MFNKKTTGELRAMFNSDHKSIFTCKIWREEASLSEASLESKGYRDWCLEFPKTTKKHNDSDKYIMRSGDSWLCYCLYPSVTCWAQDLVTFCTSVVPSPNAPASFLSVWVLCFPKYPHELKLIKLLVQTLVIGSQWQSAIYQLLVFHWETKETRT